MIRATFTLAAGLSLLLCVAVCVLWVRGQGTADGLIIGSWNLGVVTFRDRLAFAELNDSGVSSFPPYIEGPSQAWSESVLPMEFDVLGFAYAEEYLGMGAVIALPYWFVIALLGGLPSFWIITLPRRRRNTRLRRGQCVTCGYSLTGNTSGECPECGRAVAG